MGSLIPTAIPLVLKAMQNTISLSSLGPRICILGPSNSGKSTLATAIARKCDLRPVHLDQLMNPIPIGYLARQQRSLPCMMRQSRASAG